VPLVFCGLAGLARGSGDRRGAFPGAVLLAMTAAVMTRPALVRPATGPPDFYQFGRGNRLGRCHGGNGIHRCGIARSSRLGC